jgi:SAM-dependent methyltransferase
MPKRVAFDAALVQSHTPPKPTVVDLGGGTGIFASVMGALGGRSILVDDHYDFRGKPIWDTLTAIWEDYGVEVEALDVLADGLGDTDGVDAITAFHLVEHLHNSPRDMLQDAASRLRPGGVLVIAVPNAANIRKRITTMLRGSPATDFSAWYDDAIFRGHVREPVAADLVAIANDIGLSPEIIGRNFIGLSSDKRGRRLAAKLSDPLLRRRPSLCSDLYLIGKKPR